MRRFTRLSLAAVALPLASTGARAQVVLDGSLGPAGPLQGPNFLVPDTAGQLHGGNLFHSFSELSIAQGEILAFTGPAEVNHILARVTGTKASTIDGTIGTLIPGASLFLINPRGITFGPNASVVTDGAFVATTADVVRLGNDGRFAASTAAADSVLSSAPPAAFGFLTANPAAIRMEGATLAVPAGRTATLVGGDITMAGGRLEAPAGRINVVSAGAAGEAVLDATAAAAAPADLAGLPVRGRVSIVGGRLVTDAPDDTALPSGAAFVHAGDLTLSGRGQISASGNTDVEGANGGVGIDLTGTLELTESGTEVSTATTGAAKGGDLVVQAARVVLRRQDALGGTILITVTRGAGRGGDLTIDADTLELLGLPPSAVAGGEASISAAAFSPATGATGNVTINVPDIHLEGMGAVVRTLSLSEEPGAAAAGALAVQTQRLTMRGGAQLVSGSEGAGASAPVVVVGDELKLTGDGTLIRGDTPGPDGTGGGIVVSARVVDLADSAQFVSEAFLTNGGFIAVSGTETIRLSGRARISTSSIGANAGGILLTTPRLELHDRASINSNSFGGGTGGLIAVNDPTASNLADIVIDGDSVISTSSQAGQQGGNIVIGAASLELSGGGSISSTTVTLPTFDLNEAGEGGDIEITVGGRMLVSGEGQGPSGVNSGVIITSENGTGGSGGDVTITAGELRVEGGGVITTSVGSGPPDTGKPDLALETGLAGNAGRISITSGGAVVVTGTAGPERQSAVSSAHRLNRPGNGNGGNVEITGAAIEVSDRATVSARSTGSGDAGSVRLAATAGPLVVARGASVTSSADRANGNPAGVVLGSTDTVLLDDAVLTARAPNGNGGGITVTAVNGIFLNGSQIVTQAGGTGGNVLLGERNSDTGAITPSFIVLNRSRINANAVVGTGGNIRIVSDEYVTSADTLVTATSEQSTPGEVDISAAYTELAGGLVRLPGALSNDAAELQELCGLRVGGQTSSFISTGRGGTPLTPDGVQPSFDLPRPTR